MEDRLRLWFAAWDGNAGLVEQYLREKDDIEQLGGHNKDSTPLMIACRMGNYKCIEVLLNHQADPSHKDVQNFTALHLLLVCAEDVGRTSNVAELVSLMLDQGADMYSYNEDGDNAMSYAITNNLCSVVKVLVARHRRRADVQTRVESLGIDPLGIVNDVTGDTAMHQALFAFEYGKIDMSMVDMLIDMGADVDKPNKSRSTAFMEAARFAAERGKNLDILMRVLLLL
jgi:ankyrin repeat protein